MGTLDLNSAGSWVIFIFKTLQSSNTCKSVSSSGPYTIAPGPDLLTFDSKVLLRTSFFFGWARHGVFEVKFFCMDYSSWVCRSCEWVVFCEKPPFAIFPGPRTMIFGHFWQNCVKNARLGTCFKTNGWVKKIETGLIF